MNAIQAENQQALLTRLGAEGLVRRGLRQLPWALLTLGVLLAVLVPVIPLEGRALADSAAGVRKAAALDGVGEMWVTTLSLAAGALVVALVLGTVLALSMYAMSPGLRRYLSFLPVLPMVIPGVAHVVGFVFLFSPANGYVNTMLRSTALFDGLSLDPRIGPGNRGIAGT